MNWPLAVVAMVAIVMLGVVLASRNKSASHQRNDPPPEGPSPREQELEDEVTDLRERLKVLERIATEDRAARRLSSEIEQLRDE